MTAPASRLPSASASFAASTGWMRRARTPGSGLGLALVRAVADLHGMSIALEDAGPGLRVRLSLAG